MGSLEPLAMLTLLIVFTVYGWTEGNWKEIDGD